jgi:type 1 fimbria pilin
MKTPSLRSTRRATIAAALALAGLAPATTPAFAAGTDGTSNTIQMAVTSVAVDQAHHRVVVGTHAQNQLVPGMHLGTVEIVTAQHLTINLENCMISGDSGTGITLNFTKITYDVPPHPDVRLIETDGLLPPA